MQAGAELTLMENRFVPARFKDGYGPVGAWFLFFKAKATDSYGEDYCANKEYFDDAVARYGDYAKGLGTAIRNHLMMRAMKDGKGPILMQTPAAMEIISKNMKEKLGDKEGAKKVKHLEAEAWEDFLDMAIGQASLWAARNIEPDKVAFRDHADRALSPRFTCRLRRLLGQRPWRSSGHTGTLLLGI